MIKTHKIGTNRGRKRIWLDGKNLTQAGFHGGRHYICTPRRFNAFWNNELVLHFSPVNPIEDRLDDFDLPTGAAIRKVTGRPDGKPIIDITGQLVSETFPNATHVDVEYQHCRIVIRPAGDK